MKTDHMVKIDGKYYPAGTEVPVDLEGEKGEGSDKESAKDPAKGKDASK